MLQGAWKKLSWSLAQRGVWATMQVALHRSKRAQQQTSVPHIFDREFGVETSGLIAPWKFGGKGPNQRYANPYYGVPPSRLRAALLRWREDVERSGHAVTEYSFVDIGCGKARALMIASEMPFRQAFGVELSPQLVEVAERNLESWRTSARARCPVQVIAADATTAQLPAGPWLIFMYNPFQAAVMRRMLQRLDALAGELHGQLYLLYFVPQQEAVFAEFPQFKRLWSETIPLSAEEVAVDPVSSPEDRCSLYLR